MKPSICPSCGAPAGPLGKCPTCQRRALRSMNFELAVDDRGPVRRLLSRAFRFFTFQPEPPSDPRACSSGCTEGNVVEGCPIHREKSR